MRLLQTEAKKESDSTQSSLRKRAEFAEKKTALQH